MRLAVAATAALVALALLASACGQPQVPLAMSEAADALVTATPTPAPPTPSPTVTPTPSPTAPVGAGPTATPLPVEQPGLDSNSVRIAVIADVDTGGTADDLFRDTWSGLGAWAAEVNSRGGLGDRFVNVVPFDTSLYNHRAVLEVVCRGDYFAIVGGQSLADYEGAELLGTEACNVADFPGAVHGARRAVSPNTFLANPILNTQRQAGPAIYLAEQYPDAADKVALFYFDDLQLSNETERLREMLVGIGMETVTIDTDFEEGPSERIITRYEEFEAEAIVWNADPERLIALLQELAVNDLTPTWVLCEIGCYSEEFAREGGAAVEGVYTWIPHSPFDSPTASDELISYRYFLGQFNSEVGWSETGLQAWMAGRLFEEAFNRLMAAEPDSPTRAQLVSAAESIDRFTARGILPITDPGGRQPTPCFALMVVRNGRWVHEYPQPPRDLDCSSDNLYELVASRALGLEEPVTASATNSDLAEATDDDEIDLENPEGLPDEE